MPCSPCICQRQCMASSKCGFIQKSRPNLTYPTHMVVHLLLLWHTLGRCHKLPPTYTVHACKIDNAAKVRITQGGFLQIFPNSHGNSQLLVVCDVRFVDSHQSQSYLSTVPTQSVYTHGKYRRENPITWVVACNWQYIIFIGVNHMAQGLNQQLVDLSSSPN